MSIKALNYTARNTIGAFLTSTPDSKKSDKEYAVVTKGCDLAVERLKAEKIRGLNLLNSLPQVASIINDVTDAMEKEGEGLDIHDDHECWYAFASVIVYTAMANHYKKTEYAKSKKE